MTIAVKMTAEDLLELPADNMRHELVRGELTTMPPTNAEHGTSTFNIATLLGMFLRAHDLGVGVGAETGFLVEKNPDTVLAPDCAFVRKERIPPTGIPRKFWPFAPDLAVEVLSPSDRASEVLEKIEEWLAAGTLLVWVVDPAKKVVFVHRPNRKAQLYKQNERLRGEEVLPGFELSVAEIFH
jgi:Uma2 family endonuclease